MPEKILEMKFKAVTPLWPGGPLGGTTYKCFNGRCIGPFLPDEKQLIGRIRWLLRTVEASVRLLEGKPVKSYKEVDRLASRVFGSTARASKVIVRMEYSFPDRRKLDYFDPRHVSPPPRNVKMVEVMGIEGYRLLRMNLGINQEPKLKGKILKQYEEAKTWLDKHSSVLRDLYLLLTIPRVRLAFQGARNIYYDIYSKAPLRPNLTLKIEVFRRAGSELSRGEIELLTLAIPYTLAFLGLGKATSRGFGRFKLARFETGKLGRNENGRVNSYLKILASLDPGNLNEAFVEYGCTIVNIAAELLGSRVVCSPETLKRYALSPRAKGALLTLEGDTEVLRVLRATRVPALITALALAGNHFLKNIKHPCPYATQELTAQNLPGCLNNKQAVRDIVVALSAVGKATVKAVWKRLHGSVRSPGPGYHTWALGLPRSVKVRDSVTGYYGTSESLEEYCDSSPPIVEELRRLSPIFITTLCDNGTCSSLLEAFISPSDFEDRLWKMVHVGRHRSAYHVANVMYILSNTKLGIAHNCPRDDAGIAIPEKRPGILVVREAAALTSQLVALNWIKELLS